MTQSTHYHVKPELMDNAPEKSEPADFGGGESTGRQNLL